MSEVQTPSIQSGSNVIVSLCLLGGNSPESSLLSRLWWYEHERLPIQWKTAEESYINQLKIDFIDKCLIACPVFKLFYNFSVVRDKACLILERFSYELELKTREQNRNNKQTEIERFEWFIERLQTRVAFGWLSEFWGERNFTPENFLEINRYFALTSYCNTIGQSNKAFSVLGFSLAAKRRVHVLIFSSIGW